VQAFGIVTTDEGTDLQVNTVSKASAARPDVSMEDLPGYVIKVIEEAVSTSKVDAKSIKNIGIGILQ